MDAVERDEVVKMNCDSELLQEILTLLETAPSGQIMPKIKDEIVRFNCVPHTDFEKYKYLVEIGNMPETHVSRFVKALCDLEKFYNEPICTHTHPDGSDAWGYEGHDSHKTYYKCTICGETDWW